MTTTALENMNAVAVNLTRLRNDCNRALGIIANANPGEDEEQTVHRLRSLVGRTKLFVKTSTQAIRALQDLNLYLATVA